MDKASILSSLSKVLTPELYQQVEAQLPNEAKFADNQNQNQGKLEELASLKPEVLRSLVVSGRASEADDNNQNQNQSKLEDLMALKPSVLQEFQASLSKSNELLDNQNQNQGTRAAEVAKP